MSDHFPDFSLAHYLKVKFRKKRAGKQQQKNQTKVCKHAKRLNLRSYNVSLRRQKSMLTEKTEWTVRVLRFSRVLRFQAYER